MSIKDKVYIFVLPRLNAKTTSYEIEYQLIYTEPKDIIENALLLYYQFLGGE